MGKRKGDNRWLWTVVCTFGMLSFVPFIWAAIQVRTKRFGTAAIINIVGSATVFVAAALGGVFEAAEQTEKLRDAGASESAVEAAGLNGDAWASWVFVAVWLGSSLYALYLNPEYVQWRASRLGQQGVDSGPASSIPPPAPPRAWVPGGSAQHVPPPANAWAGHVPAAPSVQITNNIYGGVNNVNSQATTVQAGGNVSGVNGGRVKQSATSTGLQADAVLAFMAQYRAALLELDDGSRRAAETQLNQLAAEIASPELDEDSVRSHLHTLRALAHHAVASGARGAAAAGGSALMSTLLNNWPF